jgi:hypothetical protein
LADYDAQGVAPCMPESDLAGVLHQAEQQLCRDRSTEEYFKLQLAPGAERLRWFVLPQELMADLPQATVAVGNG